MFDLSLFDLLVEIAPVTARDDEGSLWPVAFALKKLTATEEAKIGALVKKAVG